MPDWLDRLIVRALHLGADLADCTIGRPGPELARGGRITGHSASPLPPVDGCSMPLPDSAPAGDAEHNDPGSEVGRTLITHFTTATDPATGAGLLVDDAGNVVGGFGGGGGGGIRPLATTGPRARIFDREYRLRAGFAAELLTDTADGNRVAELPRDHPAARWLLAQLAADALKGPTHLVVTVPDSAPWHGVLRDLTVTRETLTVTWEPVYTVPTSWLPSRPTP